MRWISALLLAVFLSQPLAQAQGYLVAPFSNRSRDATLDWIGESVAETLRQALQAYEVNVIRREDRQEAARKLGLLPSAQFAVGSMVKIAELLHAEKIIYGHFEVEAHPALQPEDGDRITIRTLHLTGRILDHRRGTKVAEFSESGDFDELANVQTRIAWQALGLLRPGFGVTLEEFLEKHPPVRVNALENYIRGLLATTPEHRHRYFTQAARLDENFPQPNFYLGRLQWQRENYEAAEGWLEKVPPGEEHYLEARFLLGLTRFERGNYEGAREVFQALLESLNTAEIYNNLGAAQHRLNLPDAIESFRKAIEIDPAEPTYRFNLAYALWKLGRYEEAADGFRAVLDRIPGDQDSLFLLGRCLKQSGPRLGEWRTENRERLRHSYDESAYRQYKVGRRLAVK